MGGRETFRQGDAIERVSHLWRIECRRLLGRLSREEYRQALANLLPAPGKRHDGEEAGSVDSARLGASNGRP